MSKSPLAIQVAVLAFAMVLCASFAGTCAAVEIEGFTEPNRSVDVATPEQGIVVAVPVRVGDFVKRNQVIAKLDDKIHVILLESARERKDARGRLLSAQAEVQLRTTRLQKLRELQHNGFGRKEEVERAVTDLDIALAELQSVEEDLADKTLQYQKLDAELRRRVIYSPLDGYVSARLKEPGEFVAPNEPNVVTVVELDPLLAKFSMKRKLARNMAVGQSV
ncbi:MAG: efflux RND transporter periplasmic adaptor subunit, partial [Pirellulaceae bacterium]|nr:efflux RND transporter periplasmic adaptor subunit [Pirellulaceae bacterium]